MRLIVPMGGRGTRLRPLSHTTPKALLPVVGMPAIARTLASFAAALPRPVLEAVFVLSPSDQHSDVPDRLRDVCRGAGVTASFAVQTEPLGTAHAIGSAGDALEGEVLTVWSDTLFQASRRASLEDEPDLVAWTVEVEDPRRFGVVARDDAGAVTGLIEKPPDDRFRETLIGAYYVRDGASLRGAIKDMVADGRTGANGEYQLTDALDALVQRGARLEAEVASEWLDVGTIPAYLDAVARTLDREGGAPVLEGVEIHPPVFLGEGATVRASVLGPYASIENGAIVRESSVANTIVFSGGMVLRSSLDGTIVGHRSVVDAAAGSVLLGDDSSTGVELAARSPLSEH